MGSAEMAMRAALAFVALAQAPLGDHEDLVLRFLGVYRIAGSGEVTGLLCIRIGNGTLQIGELDATGGPGG